MYRYRDCKVSYKVIKKYPNFLNSRLQKNLEKLNDDQDLTRKGDAVETFIKKMLRTNRAGEAVDQKTFLIDSVRSFHARECATFRQMVTVLSRPDAPNPVSVISDAINGQRGLI